MRQAAARTCGSRFRYVPSGAYPVAAVSAPTVDLDLDVFAGPFDLLLAVVLREEVSLLELELSEVVLAYIEHLEQQGELDLEVATEFLVLIASLLELKSRLMLPSAEDELGEMGPEEAVEELLARMLEYRRYRDAAEMLAERFQRGRRFLYRSVSLPPELRRVALDAATAAYEPEHLAAALGDLLAVPPAPDVSHIRTTVSLDRRLRVLRELLSSRGSFDFDEAFASDDRLTQAVTLFALLEMYRKGEATWEQPKAFGPIEIRGNG
jgi:segregation and condensation protein A